MAQQPPERYPVEEVTATVDVLSEIHDRLAYNHVNREAFSTLLTDFANGAITDARHVLARAEQLFQGHPHLVALFYGLVDPARQAARFLERVEKAMGREGYDRFLAELYNVDAERSLDAHQVYEAFRELFGKEHDDLLWGFVHFLPSKYGGSRADAPGRSRPSRAKKPRVDDAAAACYADAAADGSSRAKKPRAGNGKSRRAPTGGAMKGSVRVAPAPAAARKAGAKAEAAAREAEAKAAEVRRFRKSWEFETYCSELDAAMTRAVVLHGERAHGGASGPAVGRRRAAASLEEMFPRPESRAHLAKMYGGSWGNMRERLEHGGSRTAFALEAIVERLQRKYAEAVEEARRRRDPARVAQRLAELVRDRVHEERERQGA
ncbi:unnamed protein product [Urochloa decumbens]|uniref:Uncharacterized protein n=1 Tax=Urochloa decumbens TaxID=240449 RepID=A0ABC9CE60_9POAL